MSQFFVEVPGGSPSIPTQFVTDAGTAVPALNIINIVGGPGVTTTGAGNTVTIDLTEVAPGYVQVTGPTFYTVQPTDYFISTDNTAGSCFIFLPNNPTQFREFIIKDRTGNSDDNNITITTVGGVVQIDGSSAKFIDNSYGSMGLMFNGASYEVF